MVLKLNLNGSAEPFINYLKNFLKIRESLLLEIDTNQRAFVAKTFVDAKSIRFASLSFDDAHITITEDPNESERNGERVKIGILVRLKKLVQIVERFGADANDKGESNFDIVFNYGPMELKDSATGKQYTDYVTTEMSFVSPILKMKMDGFRISEFTYLSDEKFLTKAFHVNDPVYLTITQNNISTIVKTSDIIKMDPRNDSLCFYNEGNILFVKDLAQGKGKQPNFVYRIGELDHEPSYPITMSILREKFIKMMDKSEDDFKLILGLVKRPEGESVDRILFDGVNSTVKVVIGAMVTL